MLKTGGTLLIISLALQWLLPSQPLRSQSRVIEVLFIVSLAAFIAGALLCGLAVLRGIRGASPNQDKDKST